MNRSRVHMLGAVLFIIGALLFISAVAIIAIGDYAIASSMTDMGEFTELSSSMAKDALRAMLSKGELPSFILESMGAGAYGDLVNEVFGAIVDSALRELGPVEKFLLLAWAHAPTMRLVGLLSSLVGGVVWFITGSSGKRVSSSVKV